jgi:hypothetical protein
MTRSLRAGLLALFMLGSLLIAGSGVSAATSTATLTAGSLSIIAAPANFSYPSTPLTGDVINLTSSFVVGVNDATGSKAGWNLQGVITVLTDAGSDAIAATNHTISGVAISGVTGTAPTNSIALGQIPTTAAKIFNATANTGKGKSTETFSTALTVPADTAAGTYTATLTVTIVTGP